MHLEKKTCISCMDFDKIVSYVFDDLKLISISKKSRYLLLADKTIFQEEKISVEEINKVFKALGDIAQKELLSNHLICLYQAKHTIYLHQTKQVKDSYLSNCKMK